MIKSNNYIIGFMILFTAIPYVWSLKCWNCRSSNDPKCADPFDNSTMPITDCREEKGYSHLPGVRPTMCRKIRQKGTHFLMHVKIMTNDINATISLHDNKILRAENHSILVMGQRKMFSIVQKDRFGFLNNQELRKLVNGEWRYFRDCAYLGEAGIQGDERFCIMRTGTYNIFIEYCTCNSKDGCNSSSMINPLPLLLVSLLSFSVFKLSS